MEQLLLLFLSHPKLDADSQTKPKASRTALSTILRIIGVGMLKRLNKH